MSSFKGDTGFYNIIVSDIDGQSVRMAEFTGKKVLIVILPVSAADTSVTIAELKQTEQAYMDSLVVLGVPAREFGYNDSIIQQVKDLYEDQYPNFHLLQGVRTSKTANADQSVLFKWLTSISLNGRFDKDVQGTGSKFLIDEKGNLITALNAKVRLSHPVMKQIISGR